MLVPAVAPVLEVVCGAEVAAVSPIAETCMASHVMLWLSKRCAEWVRGIRGCLITARIEMRLSRAAEGIVAVVLAITVVQVELPSPIAPAGTVTVLYVSVCRALALVLLLVGIVILVVTFAAGLILVLTILPSAMSTTSPPTTTSFRLPLPLPLPLWAKVRGKCYITRIVIIHILYLRRLGPVWLL